MPRPVRLLITALTLIALSPSARAEGPPDTPPAHRVHHRHHRRRANLEEPAGRAARTGAAGPTERAAFALHPGKRAAEKPESVGYPNGGHLRGGVHLDLSRPWFRLVPAYETGDVRWGLPIFISMIDRAARAVHRRFPGAVLDVGDFSQRGGGDLLRHHSHESGRDGDLGFYVLDARGKQLHARTFIKFDTSMASPTIPGARYDLARNWAFVQELLTDPGAHVSHIFIAEWIRQQLLAYARPRVSHALWDRAAMTMMQPHHSLPHDDHFHVRISCPHEAHSSCIELARVAPHPKVRVARKGHASGGHVLKTPPRAAKLGRAPAASHAVSQDPLVLPVPTLPAQPRPELEDVEPDVEMPDGVD